MAISKLSFQRTKRRKGSWWIVDKSYAFTYGKPLKWIIEHYVMWATKGPNRQFARSEWHNSMDRWMDNCRRFWCVRTGFSTKITFDSLRKKINFSALPFSQPAAASNPKWSFRFLNRKLQVPTSRLSTYRLKFLICRNWLSWSGSGNSFNFCCQSDYIIMLETVINKRITAYWAHVMIPRFRILLLEWHDS